jgi:cytochrome c oxidase cbb3-type subunit III
LGANAFAEAAARESRMRIAPVRTSLFVVGLAVAGVTLPLRGQVASPQAPRPTSPPVGADAKAVTEGAVLFRQECVFCHGVGARGGMRGPDLTTGNWSHGGSAEELTATITDGVPGTAMPAHTHLKEEEIGQVVAYLRTLQQPAGPSRGDAGRGETLFFGSGRCGACHLVKGRGGRVGPELTKVGSARSRTYLIESIREPARYLTEHEGTGEAGARRYDTVTAVTNEGKKIVGVAMNEDTFTVQIMDTSDRIHSFVKRDLKSFAHEDRSVMPAYSDAQLNGDALDDLVAYMQTLRAPTPIKKGGQQ